MFFTRFRNLISVNLPHILKASVLREVLRLALSDLDQDSKQMLMRHLDQGMGSRELYDLVKNPYI